jgi:hypothetical protein
MFDGTIRKRNELGDYEETLRLYLVGDSGFPADTAVIVIVCTDEDARKTWTTPVVNDEVNCANFRFLSRGVFFRVMNGTLSQEFRKSCCTSDQKCLWYGSVKHRMPEIMSIFDKE